MHSDAMPFPKYDFYTTPELLNAHSAGSERPTEVIRGLSDEGSGSEHAAPKTWCIQELLLRVTTVPGGANASARLTSTRPSPLTTVVFIPESRVMVPDHSITRNMALVSEPLFPPEGEKRMNQRILLVIGTDLLPLSRP